MADAHKLRNTNTIKFPGCPPVVAGMERERTWWAGAARGAG
ncbi:hypothetical protein [Mycobacterium sp. NPDC004974]